MTTEVGIAFVVLFAALWAVVAILLAVMCVVDVRERRIPNRLVASLFGLWTLMQVLMCLFPALAGVSLAEAAQTCGVPHLFLPLYTLPSIPIALATAAAVVLLLSGGGVLYERLFHKEAMGAGDVKLIAVFALFLGPVPVIVCMMLACAFALLAALPARLRTFPFAPALTLAFVCVMLVEL